ncbi:MAG: flagellar biosynthesis regulator FlaF [Pseudomonadota bacterium]
MYDAMPNHYGSDPHAGYAAATRTTATGRDAEAKIFAQVIAGLNAARASFDKGEVRPMAEAIFRNDQLWIALSVDLLADGNKLPPELRSQLLDLAVFSQRHGRKVLLKEGDVQELINVNMAVMRGLKGEGVEPAEEPAKDAEAAA